MTQNVEIINQFGCYQEYKNVACKDVIDVNTLPFVHLKILSTELTLHEDAATHILPIDGILKHQKQRKRWGTQTKQCTKFSVTHTIRKDI